MELRSNIDLCARLSTKSRHCRILNLRTTSIIGNRQHRSIKSKMRTSTKYNRNWLTGWTSPHVVSEMWRSQLVPRTAYAQYKASTLPPMAMPVTSDPASLALRSKPQVNMRVWRGSSPGAFIARYSQRVSNLFNALRSQRNIICPLHILEGLSSQRDRTTNPDPTAIDRI